MVKDTNNNEILAAISGLNKRFDKMDERFDKMDERFDKNDKRFEELENTVNQDIIGVLKTFSTEVDERFTKLEKTVTKMSSQMVTKDYLDEKLYDLRGDLVLVTRKEDVKLNELVKILRNKNVLNEIEERKLLAMEPFAKLSL